MKGYNYSNCMGIGKGVYAIDQNCPYYSTNNSKMMSSWNHHDTTFNQSNVGSTDLVVCFFAIVGVEHQRRR